MRRDKKDLKRKEDFINKLQEFMDDECVYRLDLYRFFRHHLILEIESGRTESYSHLPEFDAKASAEAARVRNETILELVVELDKRIAKELRAEAKGEAEFLSLLKK